MTKNSSFGNVEGQRAAEPAHRVDIQGLRAIAILLVVLAHARLPMLEGGFVGVDVFFVISGYLITGVLVRGHLGQGSLPALWEFYAKRLKRLLPALSFMMCAVVVAAFALLTHRELVEQTTSLGSAATWLSNFYFAYTEVDYFAELRGKDLFLHTWSLGLEEQFNLAWPLLLLLAYRGGLQQRWSAHRALRWMTWTLLAVSLLLSMALSSGEHASAAYYLLHTRFWEFLVGAAVYLYGAKADDASEGFWTLRRWGAWGAAVGPLLIVGSAVGFDGNMAYPGVLALIPCVGTALVLAGGQQRTTSWTGRLLGNAWITWFGDRSYSWYLWHWPVLMIGYALGMGGDAYGSAALVLISLAIASASYRWIELPFWKGRFRELPLRRVFLLSCLAMGLPIALATFLLSSSSAPLPAIAPEVSAAQAARNDLPWIYSQSCDFSFKSSDLTPCASGNPDARKVAVLIGDSIGAQWVSALPHSLDAKQWKIVVLTKSSCPPVDEVVYLREHKVFQKCLEWREKVWRHVAEIRPDIVFVGSAASYGFTAKQWVDGSSAVFSRLAPSTGRMVAIVGTPGLSFDGPACLERSEAGGLCAETISMKPWDDVASYLSESVSRYPSARLLNLNDLVCPRGVCSARTEDGIPVFRDTQHLTDSFVRSRAPQISQRLRALGIEP